MTVLADHGSPYRATTQPQRASLEWRATGRHHLICEAGAEAALQAFAATGPDRSVAVLGALPLADLARVLRGMGPEDHLLVLGAEPYLQKVAAAVWPTGQRAEKMQFQRLGPDLRDVLCLHCRATCHAVGNRIHQCDCGSHLLVRDHFSARLGLYQGAPLAPEDDLILALKDRPLEEAVFSGEDGTSGAAAVE